MAKIDQTGLTLRYQPGAASLDDLQTEISSALEDLRDPDSDLARDASGLGFSSNEFAGAEGSIDQEGKGFGDVIIFITIFAPAANHVIKNVWDEVIWPRIKSRLGADAVGNELEEGDRKQSDSGQEDSEP